MVSGSYSGTGARLAIAPLPGAPARMALVDLARRDLLLELDDGVQQGVGPRRTASDVHVHGEKIVHSRYRRIRALVRPASGSADAHRDDVLRVSNLVVNAAHRVRHLHGDGARDDHDVGLSWRGAIDLHAKPRQVET